MRRLEKDGYIRGYAAVIDRERMGEGHVAFVQVKLSDTRSLALAEFNRAVQAVPEIEQCHMMAASFDYLLKVRTRDIAAYRRVLGERISALPHVAQTSTFVAMETVKDRYRSSHAPSPGLRRSAPLRQGMPSCLSTGRRPMLSPSVFRNATSSFRSRSDKVSGLSSEWPSSLAGARASWSITASSVAIWPACM